MARSGSSAAFAASTIAVDGRTMRSGRILCSTSIADSTTRTAQKNAATNASPLRPNRPKQAPTRRAVRSSTAK
jgi:hypothetical protein